MTDPFSIEFIMSLFVVIGCYLAFRWLILEKISKKIKENKKDG